MSETKYIRLELETIAQKTGLSVEVIRHCLEIGLVKETTGEADLAELRRVRRLQELNVNLAGIEIIVRMRRRMAEMQSQMAALRSELAELQQRDDQARREVEQDLIYNESQDN